MVSKIFMDPIHNFTLFKYFIIPTVFKHILVDIHVLIVYMYTAVLKNTDSKFQILFLHSYVLLYLRLGESFILARAI